MRRPRRAIAIPPTRPASAALPATAGTFTALAADPTARPALWAPPTTLSTGPLELLRLRLGLEPFPDGAELVLGRFVAEGVRRDEAADLGDAPDLDDRPEPPVLAEPPDGADPDLDDPPDLDERPDFADPPDRLLDDFGRSADLWLFCAI